MRRAALALAATAVAAACGGRSEPRPDVILVVVDTLRADRLSCYGYERPTSPTVDRLAREGVLFEDCTAQFAWTVPSMVSLMSGRYVTDWREVLAPDVPALAEVFRDAGYRTFASVANQLLDAKGGFARGFEHYDAGPSKHRGRRSDPENSRDLSELMEDLEGPLRAALAEEGERRAPFLVYLHPFEPHDPYWPRKRFEGELPLDAAAPAWPSEWHLAELARDGAPPDPERLEVVHRFRGQYDHEVRYLDEQLGDALERLDALGLLERAVVALVADHGEGLWDHRSPLAPEEAARAKPAEFFYGEHGASLHQEAIATPFVLQGAGVPAGVRVRAAVENVDLAPTLFELADVAPPPGLHGRSLMPLARGADEDRALVFSYASDGRSCVREPESGLKLVLEEGGATARLFDLGRDPLERADLAAERPDDVERLRSAFLAWQAGHGGGEVNRDLVRDDLEALERLRRLGYTETDVGR